MKRFTVDVHWDFARSYEVDADNKEDAEHKVESMMLANNFNPLENGFEKIEDFVVRCSGEVDKNGNTLFY
jgi:hypothetical protein